MGAVIWSASMEFAGLVDGEDDELVWWLLLQSTGWKTKDIFGPPYQTKSWLAGCCSGRPDLMKDGRNGCRSSRARGHILMRKNALKSLPSMHKNAHSSMCESSDCSRARIRLNNGAGEMKAMAAEVLRLRSHGRLRWSYRSCSEVASMAVELMRDSVRAHPRGPRFCFGKEGDETEAMAGRSSMHENGRAPSSSKWSSVSCRRSRPVLGMFLGEEGDEKEAMAGRSSMRENGRAPLSSKWSSVSCRRSRPVLGLFLGEEGDEMEAMTGRNSMRENG